MVKSPKQSNMKKGRLPKEESEPIKERAEVVYLLVRQGTSFKRAWKKAWPKSKAAERNWSRLAKRDYDWFKANFEEDAREMLRLCGLDPFSISAKISSLMQAEKSVGQIKKGDDIIPIMAADNSTQIRAASLAANIWGMTDPKETSAIEKLTKFEMLLPVIVAGLNPDGRQRVLEAIGRVHDETE